MSQYREYQAKANGQSACTYSRLKDLTSGPQQLGSYSTNGTYSVPLVCPSGTPSNYPPRHDTLSHGQQYVCGGYFQLKGAYQDPCQESMVSRPCTGQIQCDVTPAPTSESYCKMVKEGYCGSCGI